MGPAPDGAALPAVVLRAPDGLAAGDAPEQYRGPDGASLVEGALAVVGRGGGTIAEKAAQAAAAGAAALAVWDQAGPASFPAGPTDGALPLPVVGMGSRQGQALADLAGDQPALRVALRGAARRRGGARRRILLLVGADRRRPPEARPRRAGGRPRGGVAGPRPGRSAARGGPHGHQRRRRRGRRPGAAAAHRPPRPRAAGGSLGAGPVGGPDRRGWPSSGRGPGPWDSPGIRRSASTRRSWRRGRRAPARSPGSCSRDLTGRPGRYVVSLRTDAGEAPLGGGRTRLGPGGRAELRLGLPAVGAARHGSSCAARGTARPSARGDRDALAAGAHARRRPSPPRRSAPTRASPRSSCAWGCSAARTPACAACACTACGWSCCPPAAGPPCPSRGRSRGGRGRRAPTASWSRAASPRASTSRPGATG